MIRKRLLSSLSLSALAGVSLMLASCHDSNGSTDTGANLSAQDALQTATPIKHLVVIFGENQSFDHYFGTYPQSTDPTGEPTQTWVTPANVSSPNNYLRTPTLLTANPNTTNAANLAKASAGGFSASYMNPFRIDRAQYDTASMNHSYLPEQEATDNLLNDAFVAYTGKATSGGSAQFGTVAQVMGYFDGNTVTGMWNYAQNYAMSDNAWTDSFGPSTPGAINVISGQTAGATTSTGAAISNGAIDDGTGTGTFTVIGDADPTGDVCSSTGATFKMGGKNIGDLLTAAKITWGGFMGGFNLTTTNSNGTTACKRSTVSPNTGRTVVDYTPHHAWFQYYGTTANINHTRPSSTAMIGYNETTDSSYGATAVNHQYDYNDFVTALSAGNFPSVSFIKAPAYQDAHPSNSNPLDEQSFVTKVLNFVMQQADWKSTAVIIAYDDSDGWYDHQAPNIVTSSFNAASDAMNAAGQCTGPNATQGVGLTGKAVNGRCGPGTRTPFIVISPYAKKNYIDSTQISQASIIRFIEDNWLSGARIGGGSNDSIAGSILGMFDFTATPRTTPVYLDPTTGKISSTAITS